MIPNDLTSQPRSDAPRIVGVKVISEFRKWPRELPTLPSNVCISFPPRARALAALTSSSIMIALLGAIWCRNTLHSRDKRADNRRVVRDFNITLMDPSFITNVVVVRSIPPPPSATRDSSRGNPRIRSAERKIPRGVRKTPRSPLGFKSIFLFASPRDDNNDDDDAAHSADAAPATEADIPG